MRNRRRRLEAETPQDSEGVACLLVRVLSRSRGEGTLNLRADVLWRREPADPEHLRESPSGTAQKRRRPPAQLTSEDEQRSSRQLVALMDSQPSLSLATAVRKQWHTAMVEIGKRYRRDRLGVLSTSTQWLASTSVIAQGSSPHLARRLRPSKQFVLGFRERPSVPIALVQLPRSASSAESTRFTRR